MNSTTTTATRVRSTSSMALLAALVAVVSTGCSAAEIDTFLTLLRILGFFI